MLRAARALLLVALVGLPPSPALGARDDHGAGRPLCTGRYADTLSAMRATARERESRPSADWVYCLRATAVYEHLSYGRGGKVVHEYHTKVRHGTGFAYREKAGEWLVATNQHVIAFPEVTAGGHDVEGVPGGSRRIREEVRIVVNEAEPDTPDQIVLRTVATDEPLDMAVLSSREPLQVVPYGFGRSSELHVGDAVLVRGYPLGAFPAANAGRVIALGQRDLERGWDHEDFAVDALLNLGSSGSPVLAVSCETGEPEVVGIYHAGYRNAQGMNVVIAIDEMRALLDGTRGRTRAGAPRERGADPAEVRAALSRGALLIPFGRRTVRVEREGDAVRFAVLDAAFPLSARVELSIVDRGSAADGRAADLRSALWEQLGLVLRYRAAEEGRDATPSPPVRERIAARLREGEEEQEHLLTAAKAGALGLPQITRSERDPAAQAPAGGSGRPGQAALEVILGKPRSRSGRPSVPRRPIRVSQ